jgi:hypothetical protein
MASRFEQALGTRRAVAIAIAVAMAFAATSISIGFLTDDHAFRAALHATSAHAPAPYDLFRFVPGDLDGNQLRIRTGHLPWWAAADLEIHFLRPLTSLAFVADDAVFGASPLGYHLVSLAWYLALLLAAAAVFRGLLPAPAATLALALFGLSAAHVEAYAWISARHVVLAGAFGAAALALRPTRHGRWLGPLVFAVGLGASEATLAVVPLWIGFELATPRPWRARLLACLPVLVLALAYLALYAVLGAGTRGSGGYHDPASDPLGFLALAALRIPLFLGTAALGIPAELAHVVAEWKLAVLGLAATAFVALGLRLTRPPSPPGAAPSEPRPSDPREPTVRALAWIACGGIGATALGAAGFPAGRMLVLPDLAFAAILGVVLSRGLGARWPGRLLAAVLAIVHLLVAPLATLHTVHKLADRAHATHAIATRAAELAPASGRVFLVAASDPMVFLYPRGILADQAPGAIRCWSVLSAAHASHRFTRTGRKTFTLEPIDHALLDGSFDRLFRSPDRPFAVGDTVEQCGASIRVAAVRDGRPTRLEISLRRALEDPELGWLTWQAHHLERFIPPAIGASIEIPWSSGPSGVL